MATDVKEPTLAENVRALRDDIIALQKSGHLVVSTARAHVEELLNKINAIAIQTDANAPATAKPTTTAKATK